MFRTMHRITVGIVLVAVACILTACGGHEQESKRYSVEKEFAQARSKVENFSVKPELRSTDDYYEMVSAYLNVWEKYRDLFSHVSPGDSLTRPEMEATYLAGRAILSAVGLLLQADQLDSASTLLNHVLDNRYFPLGQRYDALLMQGRIASDQGRWLDAEELYEELLREKYPPYDRQGYPDVDVLNLPSTIVEHYMETDQEEIAREKANWAIEYYRGLAEAPERTPVQLIATRKLAEMYAATGQHRRAVDLLETVVDSTGQVLDPARAMIADLYVTQLDRRSEAINIYRDLIENGDDSLSIAMSYIKLATLLINDGKYQEGRNYLDELKMRFPLASRFLAQAQRLKANSFELQENYERARQEYVALINEYPASPQTLETLVYLPEMFERINQPVLQRQWTERAESRLREMIRDYSDRRIGAQAGSYLGTFLLRNGRYREAIEQFEQLRQLYPKSSLGANALIRIGMIYKNDLKNNSKALEAFREFLKQYPNSVVRSQVEKQIEQLEKS